ncbi:unnamed protein product [Mytilus coruscus]|uniref:Uncharacterized protein n=1 Tax=Mytilus coruscus TaxID=42192 RepID=A0A6J8CIB1_MYTCO|nr:unnamed protein product [Mytilus coruscus]
MNVLDTHKECYRHRICHKAFPCNICREWDDERRSLVDKMLDKARSKLSFAGNSSVEEIGKKNTAKLSELASPSDKQSKVIIDHCADDLETQSSSTSAGEHYEVVEFNKFIADQISVVSHEVEDEISIGGSAISDENNNDFHSRQSQPSHDQEYSLFSKGAPGSTDPIKWNNFLHKLTAKLKINCSEETEVDSVRTSYLPSKLNPGNSDKAPHLKLPLEGTTIEVFKNVEKEAMSGRLKIESEDDRVEACSALVACFKSMADMTSRIIANSVINRRKIFLKNVDFSSKATSAKLLNLPLNGAQLFGDFFVSHEVEDEISIGGSAISDENNNDFHSSVTTFSRSGIFSVLRSRTDPIKWNNFLHKLTAKLKINCSEETEVDSVRTFICLQN